MTPWMPFDQLRTMWRAAWRYWGFRLFVYCAGLWLALTLAGLGCRVGAVWIVNYFG